MLPHQETRRNDVQLPDNVVIDGLLRDGVDCLAARRAHLRNLTMARQEAERRYERRVMARALDHQTRLGAARSRAEEFRMELNRLDIAHRTWLRDQGEDAPERLTRWRNPH